MSDNTNDTLKPSWDDAPEWANWLAQDLDASWWWHQDKPIAAGEEWTNAGFMSQASVCPIAEHWRDSLELRPGGDR